MPTRRKMLSSLAALGATAAAGAGGKYKPRLAAQCYVWTQQFQTQHKTLADGIPEALAGTRRAGYRRMELMSVFFQPETRENTFGALKEHGLEVPIVYHGGPMHEAAGADKTIAETLRLADIVKSARTHTINLNPNPKPKGERKSDEELKTQAHYVNQLGKELAARGMRLILHHHNPEMAENAREWRHLLEHTQTGLCVDVHWVYRGGQDPMTILHEAGKRLASLHLRNSRQGTWTEELEDGDIDYRQVAAYLKQSRFDGYLVVELAYEKGTTVSRPLEEDLRRSRVYAEKVFT